MMRALPLLLAISFVTQAAPAAPAEALLAAEEAQTFSLPDGFTAELVLAESTDPANLYGKFVALAFDGHGRLWTTTALEYPVDANESPELSQRLFAAGGRDKVLVVDDPWAAKPSAPRVFAGGLAIPLGVLPWRDGAFVQYGTEIRFYRDANGDGRADGHETVLDGFGVQDSHLFPHQFTRVPGGWILLAQGLFNSSMVKRPSGAAFADGSEEIRFEACKLGRFKPDGSAFEPLTAGPNNIWGLTIARTGETWLQEANDMGYPVFPYEPGIRVATNSSDRLRPYQPLMPPPLAPPQMGGSGLSGLALADDLDGWPAPWGAGANANPDERIFYVANPITNAIQTIVATRAGSRYKYRKGPDLLVSGDKSFRPVALQFGPDGCLYVVDWYNKIISHNEVPRTDPERDRVRGRIWRIRHASQPVREPVAVATLPTDELPKHLGSAKARVADLAWQEIVDRHATELVPALQTLAGDAAAPVAARVGAVWAIEGLAAAATPLLEKLAADPDADLRHEAIRVAAVACSEADFRRLAAPLVDDPSPRVRAALGDALRRIPVTSPETIALIVRFGRGPARGDPWTVYDRDFERYLARWAMERHAGRVAAFLGSPAARDLPAENRLLATLALEPRAAATALARLLPDLGRPPESDEIRLLASQAAAPDASAALERFTSDPHTRSAALAALLAHRTGFDAKAVESIVSRAATDLLESEAPADRHLALEAVGAFKLTSLAPRVAAIVADRATQADDMRAALRCLRELAVMSADTGRAVLAAAAGDRRLRAEAVAAWAESRDPAACRGLVAAWDDLDFTERQAAAAALSRHREGAAALVAALADEAIDVTNLPSGTVADMRAVLGDDPALERIWADLTAAAPEVLSLAGHDADAAAREEKFARFRALAAATGDAAKGRELFTTRCLNCHQQGGTGGRVGPALDGVGLTGVEAILRNVLTPSAAMEGGYRSFRVVTGDGRMVQGLLVSQDADALVIRQPDVADVRIPVADVDEAGFTGVSIMPEGLLESLEPQQVSDLFAHLKSLQGVPPGR